MNNWRINVVLYKKNLGIPYNEIGGLWITFLQKMGKIEPELHVVKRFFMGKIGLVHKCKMCYERK